MTATRTDTDAWDSGAAYERYVGRWSREVAATFVEWIDAAPRLAWCDVGCGTGALTSAIIARAEPAAVHALDASEDFIVRAQQAVSDPRARFAHGDAMQLPWPTAGFDVSASGLVLNFIPEPLKMVREMARVTRRGGNVALYVWDYADGMEMLRLFWDAAAAEDPSAVPLDEATRFTICTPDALRDLFTEAPLDAVDLQAIEIPTVFETFDDYWKPFLGRTGPAPAYLASRDPGVVERIRARLHLRLTAEAGEPIELVARAWAVRGRVP